MVYQYYCSGSEVSLQLCSKHAYQSTSYNAESWYSRVTAAVECQQEEINITSEFLPSVVSVLPLLDCLYCILISHMHN